MSQQLLFNEIETGNSVTRNRIAESKIYLVNNFQTYPNQMLHGLLASRDLELHNAIDLINNTVETYGKHLADCSSWWNSGVQALWELQGQGVFIPSDNDIAFHVDRFMLHTGGGGSKSEMPIHLKQYFNPTLKKLMEGSAHNHNVPLSNSDVFLSNIETTSMPASVPFDLTQVAECFRRELYLPTLVMLGRAIEGAWLALANSLPPYISDEKEKQDFENKISDPFVGISGKINSTTAVYADKKYFGKTYHSSGVDAKRLGATRQWSEQMLSYRNAIHPGAQSTIEFNYENVSVILMTVKNHIDTLNQILEYTSRDKE